MGGQKGYREKGRVLHLPVPHLLVTALSLPVLNSRPLTSFPQASKQEEHPHAFKSTSNRAMLKMMRPWLHKEQSVLFWTTLFSALWTSAAL